MSSMCNSHILRHWTLSFWLFFKSFFSSFFLLYYICSFLLPCLFSFNSELMPETNSKHVGLANHCHRISPTVKIGLDQPISSSFALRLYFLASFKYLSIFLFSFLSFSFAIFFFLFFILQYLFSSSYSFLHSLSDFLHSFSSICQKFSISQKINSS